MNQSVNKALQLLDLFVDQEELSLHEISIKANIPKPTAYRLLTTLENNQFLYKTKETRHDSRYRLGIKLLEYGQLVSERFELRRIALPDMEQLALEVNEAVHLVIVNKGVATYIEKVDSTRALRLNTRIGKSSPLHIGSGPKLLLAFLRQDQQAELLAGELNLHGEPVDKRKLSNELKQIKEQGYAYSVGEQDVNTTGISYPIYNYKNKVVAALAVSGLSTYFEADYLPPIKEKTATTANAISKKLGY